MELLLNPRGNGACPLCVNSGNCRIQRQLMENVGKLTNDQEMEIVIYTCPYFREKV